MYSVPPVGLEQEELRDREALYRAMFETNTAIKLLIDPGSATIVDASPAAAAFYGWSLVELRGMPLSAINPSAPDELRDRIERARTMRQCAFHFRHRTATGELRDVDVYTGPIVLGGRELLFSIIHDVTARVQLEAQVQHTHRIDALGQLAVGVAHDFNNLLAIALSSLDCAEQKLAAGSDPREDLADLRRTVEQGAVLTHQLLAIARQDRPVVQLADVGAMIGRVTHMLQRVLGPLIDVRTRLTDELPRLHIDSNQLELAFINLALNARDAMTGGGTLEFRAGVDGEYVHVVVSDTGHGMDDATRARAFEPFFSTKPPGFGTGLGLAAVHGLVEQVEGKVWIDSAPGAGTAVHMALPIGAVIEQPRAMPRATARSMKAMRSVLLVEDRPDVRRALEHALAVLGLGVHVAGSAAEALAVLDDLGGTIDVVLSDMAMPGASGLDLAHAVRKRWPALPVVLMSGSSAQPPSPEVAAWLEKPFSLDDVLAVIDRVASSQLA